jgi:1,4-dihydroxy-2-naphthoate polyprenyltransferase
MAAAGMVHAGEHAASGNGDNDMEQAILGPVLRAARPNFLTLTPVCVFLGVAAAATSTAHVSAGAALLVLLAALLAHLSVNLLNEYHDFRSGLDSLTHRTPFSGGSGSLPAHPEAAAAVGAAGVVTLLASVTIGLYFIALKGWELLPLGILGILLVGAYTPLITRRPLLCLLAPGLGFGPVMVAGSAFVLAGHYSWAAAAAALPPFFLVSELLLINQFPDVEADAQVGRRHLPITIGRRRSALLFSALVGCAYLAVIAGVVAGVLPRLALLALLTLPVGVLLMARVPQLAEDTSRLVPYLGANVAMIHAMLLLLAIGMLLG